jgi:hypothetical protein
MVPPPVAHMIKRRQLLGYRDSRTSGQKLLKGKSRTRSAGDARNRQ